MAIFLQVDNLAKSYGDRLLFGDVSFALNEGDKVGIIAENGSGKSTMLKIIAGEESADSGAIWKKPDLRIGYLAQDPQFDNSRSILENVIPQDVHGEEAWSMPDRARHLLSQFRIDDFDRRPDAMSGGQLKRAAIVRVLLSEPELLVLDEPTNHLDIDMIEWLEDYLTRNRVTLLMVTHDRYFLDNICNRIIEIDRQQIYSYNGNYDYYLQKREERMENLSAELAKVKNILRTELEWMRRQPQARGSKAKYRIDNFHELERRSKVDLSHREVKLDVDSSYIGSKIFEAHNVSKSFGDLKILDDWSYTFARYEKVGIVGANGVGKSTFIKMLLGELKPDSGYFEIGQTVRWGYYSQDGITGFDEKKRVIDAVTEYAETIRPNERTSLTPMQFLNRFLFSPQTQQKYIYKLSGGEKRRLYLATVLMRNPNFLILDEPTNDLDIVTLSILEDYLAEFKGCVIVVSHDRFFLNRIADHLFVFKGNGVVKDFPGDYSTYRHCLEVEQKEQRAQQRKEEQKTAPVRPKREQKNKLTFKERREMEELERRLLELEGEKATLEAQLSSGTLDHERLAEASSRIGAIIAETDEAEMRLLELMEKEP